MKSALGEPNGAGRETLTIAEQPLDMWTYYYEEADYLKDARRVLLIVFFDGDRYAGYLWFSSFVE